jgi:hypothetical protein
MLAQSLVNQLNSACKNYTNDLGHIATTAVMTTADVSEQLPSHPLFRQATGAVLAHR